MNARYYVPYLNRFISADSIIPNEADPQSYNRYSYVRNNPLRYTDPTGHCLADDNNSEFCDPIDYGYLRARQVAIEWLLDELRQPFQEDPPVNRGFSSTHNGVDFGGDITVTAPASGTVTEAGPDGPAGMWKLERLNEDGECCVPGATREWSVFETATDDPLYESDRGEDGLLEPERLLASGEWVEATDATGWSHTQGTVIVVQHEHNLETVYYHTIPSVQTGTTVNQGDVLGQTTNNGWSSGTHLHYSIRFTYNGESEWLDLTVLGLDQ